MERMGSFSRRELLEVAGTGLSLWLSGPLGSARAAGGVPMVLIPAGKFLKGTTPQGALDIAVLHGYDVSWLDMEVPQREFDLAAFEIDLHPVTVWQYAQFCAATGYPEPRVWRSGLPLKQIFDHPVVGVSRFDAEAYASWAEKRLPREEEWEKAARGPDGRTFPWGDVFDPDACRWNREHSPTGPGTAPVLTHPRGDSPYGVSDMAGNAAEWCLDGPHPAVAFLKGGSWYTEEVLNLRPAARTSVFRNVTAMTFGFRCARDVT
jgi:formylglycine-generating enzyme required for sulfatase activity